ncbi:MAG: hypothetical protein K8F58_07330 [Bauldia sp.]|nr:hypothetical protein [Bauldia sp.]
MPFCATTENGAACAREWIGVLGPTIGIIVSAILILRQIRVNRAQFFPPALEYLDRANSHLSGVRFQFLALRVILLDLMGRNLDPSSESALLEVFEAVRGKVDPLALTNDIARCHLAEPLHDTCTAAAGEWAECSFNIDLSVRQLEILVGEKPAKRPEHLRRELSTNVPDIKERAGRLLPVVEEISQQLRDIFLRNHRRLHRIGEEVGAEIDRRH